MSDDKTLSDAYRSVSTEKTPELLDRRILAMAKEKKPVNRWRHIGLAATVVLCFAFLVDIGQFTGPSDTVEPELLMLESVDLDDAQEPAAAVEPERAEAAKEEVVERLDADATRQPVATVPVVREKAVSTQSAVPTTVADRARRLEETRTSSDQSRLDARTFDSASAEAESIRHCTPAQTADAQSWYACILSLRKDGMDDAANDEQSLLQTKFPDFEIR